MKKLLLISFITFISFHSKAQLDTIPNAGFENWNYTPIWTIEASGWQSNNSSIAAWNVEPDSISHSGILSLKLEKISYRGIIWSGFPLSQHPAALEGYMKNGLGIGDTALIQVHLYSSNVLVDSGYSEIYGGIGTNFLPFYVSISQNISSADSCVITLTGGNQFGSVIWFDDLVFSFPSSTPEQDTGDEWKIFPNPASNEFTIYDLRFTIYEIEIYDVFGKIIYSQQQTTNNKQQTVDISQLSSGIYMVNIIADKKRSSCLIVKE